MKPISAPGLIYFHLGNKEAAFKWLDKAYANREARLIYLNIDPLWNALRPDPRFADPLRGIGIPGSPASSPR